MRHWFNTIIAGQNEDGSTYTIGTQMFYVDDEQVLIDLRDAFRNAGLSLVTVQTKAYLARNSVIMRHDGINRPMAKADDTGAILMGFLAAGFGAYANPQDVTAYAMHLKNTLKLNAVGAYMAERRRALGEDGAPGGDQS